MDSKKLYQKQVELTNELRGMLDQWESKTNTSSNEFDAQANGQYKERCAKIEADLDAVESQLRTAKKIERNDAELNEPMFNNKGLSVGTRGDSNEDWGHTFIRAIRKGDNNAVRECLESSSNEYRLMSKDTLANQPKAAIPTNFDEIIRQKLYQNNVIRQLATVRQIDTNKKITIEAALPTTELVAESASMAGATDPTFGSLIDVFPRKFMTKVVCTNEFLDDALTGNGGVGNIINYIAEKIGQSQGRSHENYFCNGVAATEPQGIALSVASITGVNSITVTANTALSAITGDNLVDTYFALSPQYRANASWVFSDALLKNIRKIKVLSSGSNEYLFKIDATGDLREGVSGLLLGRPVYISPFFNTATTTGKVLATLADFRFYEIFDRTGMSMLVDPYTLAGSGQTNLYATTRLDAKIVQGEAFSLLAEA